jgi:hypothetical protein
MRLRILSTVAILALVLAAGDASAAAKLPPQAHGYLGSFGYIVPLSYGYRHPPRIRLYRSLYPLGHAAPHRR